MISAPEPRPGKSPPCGTGRLAGKRALPVRSEPTRPLPILLQSFRGMAPAQAPYSSLRPEGQGSSPSPPKGLRWFAAGTLAYYSPIKIMRTEQSRKPGKPRLSRFPALLKCKGFGRNCPKPLHLPRERRGAPVEIRIETMAKFHKSGSKEPFLWNCAATAAQINRKAVYSVDIMAVAFLFRLFLAVILLSH